MTPRCQLCGEFESGNTDILQGYDVCYDCITNLIDNEVERRMERQAEQESGRDYRAEFRDRQIEAQQLKR